MASVTISVPISQFQALCRPALVGFTLSACSVPGQPQGQGRERQSFRAGRELRETGPPSFLTRMGKLSHGVIPKTAQQNWTGMLGPRSSCLSHAPGHHHQPLVCSGQKTGGLPSAHSWTTVVALEASASSNQ